MRRWQAACERCARTCTGTHPAKPVRSAQEQREHEELTARCDKRGGPFEPGVEAAKRRLAYMQNLYQHGGFMGHPEDLLEDIEREQRHIKRLTAETAQSV